MIRVDHLPLDFDPSHVSFLPHVRRDFEPDLLADQISAVGDGWLMVQPVERKRFDRRRILNLIDMAMAMLQPVQ